MILLELFSGIGGFSKGLEAAGYAFDKVYFSEIDKHAIANFKYNYPYAEHIGTVTNIGNVEIERPHIITFGSPCQNFSPVGDGKGLQGAESHLVRYAVEAVRRFRPDIFIWENVKGILFARHRSDFWSIIKAFADIGNYRLEWQLCNTAWFLPQNRERMYLIGRIADKCTADLFPLRQTGTINCQGKHDPSYPHCCGTLMRGYYRQPNLGNYLLRLNPDEAYNETLTPEQLMNVRMLTEIECERLQGFPDNYTRYGMYDGEKKEIAKAHRYALLGNAVSVPVVREVATRIMQTTLF